MKKITDKILTTWHKHFEDEENQYSEFESSDVEYFVACMLYNHFAFSKALDNLKTMDLSYDFLSECGDDYESIKASLEGIHFDDEVQSLEFLQNFIKESKAKYTKPELYLLDRVDYHVGAMAERYMKNIDVQRVDFENPLLRK